MALVAWLAVATLQSANRDMADLVRDTARKTARASQMRDAVRLRSAAVGSLQRMNRVEEGFGDLVAHTTSYVEARDELLASSFGADARERAVLDDIDAIGERVADVYGRVNELVGVMSTGSDALERALGELQAQELVLLARLEELVALERALPEQALAAHEETYRDTRGVLVGIVVVAFALAVLMSLLVIRRVSAANRRIAHLASHDDLTGVHNRRSFEEQLTRTIGLAGRDDGAHGLLYLDLDRFKIVNDTCGHHAGDRLLIDLTGRIASRLRRGDLLARVGGDEFAVIAHSESFDDIHALAEDLRQIAADYVFEYEGQVFRISVSIGLVPIGVGTVDLERLLAEVDSACYVAKQSGRNRVHIATDGDRDVVRFRSDVTGVRAIHQALAEDRLSLYFQPVFGLSGDSLTMAHCEVLLRIRSDNGELYSPKRFIQIAEKYNVMSEIDRWVVERVVDWVAAHQGDYHLPRLLVNLSGLSFGNAEFCNFVVERLERGDVDPSRLAFEITETAAIDHLDKARGFVERVRALGCQFALDDFGSGFSTFGYLKHIPIDYLKIDGMLVRGIVENPIDREMVDAINRLGHVIGAFTVAEFVEDDATVDALREIGVDYAQGYGLRVPSPLERLVDELEPRLSTANQLRRTGRGTRRHRRTRRQHADKL